MTRATRVSQAEPWGVTPQRLIVSYGVTVASCRAYGVYGRFWTHDIKICRDHHESQQRFILLFGKVSNDSKGWQWFIIVHKGLQLFITACIGLYTADDPTEHFSEASWLPRCLMLWLWQVCWRWSCRDWQSNCWSLTRIVKPQEIVYCWWLLSHIINHHQTTVSHSCHWPQWTSRWLTWFFSMRQDSVWLKYDFLSSTMIHKNRFTPLETTWVHKKRRWVFQ